MANQSPTFPNANPSWHTITLVIATLLLCSSTLPRIAASIDDVATIEACTTPIFPDLMTRSTLGWIRTSIGVFIFIITICLMRTKQVIQVHYLKTSKLRSIPVTIQGISTQGYFTSWSWNILGLSFLLSGLLTFYVDYQLSLSPTITDEIIESLSSQINMKIALRASILLFEVAAPASMLVSSVVRYAIWPKALKGNGTQNLKKKTIMFQHNSNIIFSLMEVGLLGGLKVRFTDMAVAPMFGLLYVLFAWSVKHKWLDSGEPQFLYFFLDTTLGKGSTIALAVLLVVLSLFYAIFALVDDFLVFIGGGLGVHLAVVIGIASLVCRFRD